MLSMALEVKTKVGARSMQDEVVGEATDSDLMARIRDDDREAFRLLLRRHLPRAYGLARRLTGTANEAEDIAQDAFLQIWQRRAQWQDDGAKFTTWLYRVVANRAIDHRRRPRAEAIDVVSEHAAEGPDAVSTIQRVQVTERLRLAQERLPEQQRVAIALYYYEGLTAADVADVMNTTLGAVESLLKRARQNLRQSLKGFAVAVRDSFADE